jgi:pimeloyl-ACP methyl ester carboxylesterase
MAPSSRSFWVGGAGLLLLIVVAVLVLAAGGGVALVYQVSHPPRDRSALDPADLMLQTEDATFQASGGPMLSGWFVAGRRGWPAIVLCHDLGGARSSLLNTAAALNRSGYPLLLFDFRGHGLSGGKGTSFGVDERLDVLAAIEYLKGRRDIDTTRFGVWGIGMGAYAAVLAAAEEPSIVALALDSLEPDAPAEIDRLLKETLPPALHAALPAVGRLYEPFFGFRLAKHRVRAALPGLTGRNILFIASPDLPDRFAAAQALYALLPEGSGDKNFLQLRASVVSGLYAEDKRKYDEALVTFFTAYLRQAGRGGGAPSKIQVIER